MLLATSSFPGRPAAPVSSGSTTYVFAETPSVEPLLPGDDLVHPDRLAALEGDFTFIAFDGLQLHGVRSAGGCAPLWIHRDGRGVALSTSLSALLDALGGHLEFDLLVCAMWAASVVTFPDGRSFYKGVSLVDRGHVVSGAPARSLIEKEYWEFRPSAEDTRVVDPQEHAEELRAALVACLESELPTDELSLLTVSGGVDSTSLAALASRTMHRPVRTLSLLPPPGPDRVREEGYVRAALNWANIESATFVTWSSDWHVSHQSVLPPLPMPVPHPALRALADLPGEMPKVFFGGEFADDVCGHAWRLTDWVEATAFLHLITHARHLPFGVKDAGRWVKRRLALRRQGPRVPARAELPSYFDRQLRDEYREWWERQFEVVQNDTRPNRHLASQLRINSDGPIAMNWEVLTALHVRRVFPFHTRRVLDLAGRTDVRDLMGPGGKTLFKRALAEDANPTNLYRRDKGQWGQAAAASWTLPEGEMCSDLMRVLETWPPPSPVTAEHAVTASTLIDLTRSQTVPRR